MEIPASPPSGPKGPLPWDRVVLSLHNLFEIWFVENNKRCEEGCNREYLPKISELDKAIRELEELIVRFPDAAHNLEHAKEDLERLKKIEEEELSKCLGNCHNASDRSNELLGKLGVSLGIPAKGK